MLVQCPMCMAGCRADLLSSAITSAWTWLEMAALRATAAAVAEETREAADGAPAETWAPAAAAEAAAVLTTWRDEAAAVVAEAVTDATSSGATALTRTGYMSEDTSRSRNVFISPSPCVRGGEGQSRGEKSV